jgi:SAM-dependent methyltransferase
MLFGRQNKFIQLIKPPDPTFNTNRKKVHQLISRSLKQGGKVLDLGSGGRKLDNQVVNFDVGLFDSVHVVGDACQLPFRERIFSLIIVTAVLEHIKYPQQVVVEIRRCLKQNGRVYAEIPFLQAFHADPHDYQRYTISGLKVLFNEFEEEESGVCAGPISVLTWYLRKFPTIFFKNELINKAIEFITGWIFFFIKYLDFLFARTQNAHILASGLYYIGNKRR